MGEESRQRGSVGLRLPPAGALHSLTPPPLPCPCPCPLPPAPVPHQAMLAGFSDSMLGTVAGEERDIMQQHGPALNAIIQSRANVGSESEKIKGEEFINAYLKAHPTARQTTSGLVFHETAAGSGTQATANSTVLVHYHGTLANGRVFDSSVDRGEPIKFPLKQVIAGWQEGVALMKTGGKATLLCPPALAYGDRGSPPVIAPGATLRFDVELLEVVA